MNIRRSFAKMKAIPLVLLLSLLEIIKNESNKLIAGIYRGIPNLLFISAIVSILDFFFGQLSKL